MQENIVLLSRILASTKCLQQFFSRSSAPPKFFQNNIFGQVKNLKMALLPSILINNYDSHKVKKRIYPWMINFFYVLTFYLQVQNIHKILYRKINTCWRGCQKLLLINLRIGFKDYFMRDRFATRPFALILLLIAYVPQYCSAKLLPLFLHSYKKNS